MEPPYTNESEFDPLSGEDPAASASAIPTSQEPTQPSAEPAPTKSTTATGSAPSVPSSGAPASGTAAATLENEPAEESPSRTATPRTGVRRIHHPNAKKGLVRIEQDGTYVYKVRLHKTDKTGTLRFGQMEPPNIISADGQTTFAKMYGSSGLPMVTFDYDWHPIQRFGKLGLQIGTGLAMTTGNGRFLKGGTEDAAKEVYTFVVIPLNAGVTYRFQYSRTQWVAPYISAGGTYLGVAEIRDDNKRNFTGTAAGYGAGGLMFNIVALSKDLGFILDSEYGVGGLWATAEYRYLKSFSEDLDFSGSIVSLGVSAEF